MTSPVPHEDGTLQPFIDALRADIENDPDSRHDDDPDNRNAGTEPSVTNENETSADDADELVAALLSLVSPDKLPGHFGKDLIDAVIDPALDAPEATVSLERQDVLVAAVRQELALRQRDRGLIQEVLERHRLDDQQDHNELAHHLRVLHKTVWDAAAELLDGLNAATHRRRIEETLESEEDAELVDVLRDLELGVRPLSDPLVAYCAALWSTLTNVPTALAQEAFDTASELYEEDATDLQLAAGTRLRSPGATPQTDSPHIAGRLFATVLATATSTNPEIDTDERNTQ